MFWAKMAHFGPPGTPRKSAFFQERGRKRMKELGEVTFMKEGMKALDDTRILALTHLKFVVSFPRYGHLKKKCWYKKFCNSKSWLLLTGHFGPVFIRPSQWSITAVLLYVQKSCHIWFSLSAHCALDHLEFESSHTDWIICCWSCQSLKRKPDERH